MIVKRIPNFRAIEILGLLNEHGPLSFKVILNMVKPAIKEKKLHEALSRLIKKEVIVKRNEQVFGGRGTFYQISQYKEDRIKASEILGCSAQSLEQPEFRYRELIHSETCAKWMYSLKQLFPDAKYIRDFEFNQNYLAKKIMSLGLNDMDLKPDLLVVFENPHTNNVMSIAFEIERSRKSNKRLIRKLYKYANLCRVDGVVYVCESKRIKEVLQHLFLNIILPKARRIEHYPENFFLFSDNVDKHTSNPIHLLNSEQKLVPFIDWTHYLRHTQFNQRRDKTINAMGESIPPQILQ